MYFSRNFRSIYTKRRKMRIAYIIADLESLSLFSFAIYTVISISM